MTISAPRTRFNWKRFNWKWSPSLALFLGLLGVVRMASSTPILYGTMSTSGSIFTIQPNPATNLSALIAIGPISSTCFVVGNCPQIALLQGLDASAIGTSIMINSGSSNFSAVVSKLTNGSLDYISIGIVPGPSYGTSSGGATSVPETAFGTSPDFAGLTVRSLVLRVDNVLIQPVVGPPAPGGTQFSLAYTLSVYGVDVPEPATWASISLCLIVCIFKRYERR